MRREPLQEQQEIPQKVLLQKIRCQREKQNDPYNKTVKKRKLCYNTKGGDLKKGNFMNDVCKVICMGVCVY